MFTYEFNILPSQRKKVDWAHYAFLHVTVGYTWMSNMLHKASAEYGGFYCSLTLNYKNEMQVTFCLIKYVKEKEIPFYDYKLLIMELLVGLQNFLCCSIFKPLLLPRHISNTIKPIYFPIFWAAAKIWNLASIFVLPMCMQENIHMAYFLLSNILISACWITSFLFAF